MAQRPLLLGHRGMRCSPKVKENTIEAFELALQHGCDGFEFDVRLTRDGRAVVCHDPKIKGVDIGRAGESQLRDLPEFAEVLGQFHRKAFLDIELKVTGLERLVVEALRRFPPERGYVISSFLPETLDGLDPEVPKGVICETRKQLHRWPLLKVGYVMAHWNLISEELVRQTHDSEAQILVWTVN